MESKNTILNERTLVPISFLIVIVGLLAPVFILFSQVSDHSNRINTLFEQQKEIIGTIETVKNDYKLQVEKLDDKFSDMTILLTKIATKLNIDVSSTRDLESKITNKTVTFDQ